MDEVLRLAGLNTAGEMTKGTPPMAPSPSTPGTVLRPAKVEPSPMLGRGELGTHLACLLQVTSWAPTRLCALSHLMFTIMKEDAQLLRESFKVESIGHGGSRASAPLSSISIL